MKKTSKLTEILGEDNQAVDITKSDAEIVLENSCDQLLDLEDVTPVDVPLVLNMNLVLDVKKNSKLTEILEENNYAVHIITLH